MEAVIGPCFVANAALHSNICGESGHRLRLVQCSEAQNSAFWGARLASFLCIYLSQSDEMQCRFVFIANMLWHQ